MDKCPATPSPQAKHKASHALLKLALPARRPTAPSDADFRCYSVRFYLHSLDDRIEDFKTTKKKKETLLIALYA